MKLRSLLAIDQHREKKIKILSVEESGKMKRKGERKRKQASAAFLCSCGSDERQVVGCSRS